MIQSTVKNKLQEWLKRYILAEVIGTAGALLVAWAVYSHTQSYIAAAAFGWLGEGIGFFGYFITTELLHNTKKYSSHPFIKRTSLAIAAASTNLIVEFMPAEIFDNFIIRPYAMYIVPQYIHPYPLGFLVGKFSADIFFYCFAMIGYEAKKRWIRH